MVYMDEVLESPKVKILEFIIANPSSHLRKIKNNLGFSMGTIQYYLAMLENEGKIKSIKTKFYKNYYHINESDDQILSVLNLDSPRNIVMYLIQHEPSTHQEIAKGVRVIIIHCKLAHEKTDRITSCQNRVFWKIYNILILEIKKMY